MISAYRAGTPRTVSRFLKLTSVQWPGTLIRREACCHGEHEKRIGQHDANWPDWYAACMVAEQSGRAIVRTFQRLRIGGKLSFRNQYRAAPLKSNKILDC